MKKVISIVLNNFKNDSRVLKENISLQNAGYNVQVVALHDKGQKEQEIVQNIPVHRINLKSREWSKNKIIQLFKYFEFVYRVVKQYKNSDILHCNDLNTLPIGVIIKKFFNKDVKIVYDAHEHESERCHFGKIGNFVARILEKFLIKYADKVITVSNSIAEDYKNIYNIEKPVLVLNTPSYKEIEKKDIFRKKFNISKDKVIFLYQGGLSRGRGILEFAELIKDKIEAVYIVMGYGSLEKEVQEKAKRQKNMYFHEAVLPNVLLDYTSSADIGVCIEENLCKSWDYALPNKMFEYNMAKLPIIVSGLYEMKKFVKDNNTGYAIEDIFSQNEFDEIYKIILKTYKDKIENVKKCNLIYNWEKQEKVLLKVYKDIINDEKF